MVDLLRRAWDALDSFKQAYPENWNEDDQRVMDDLLKADLDLSGVRRRWVGLTDEDLTLCESEEDVRFARAIEAKLKEKNT